jgi:hypothetical protein
MKIYIQTEIAVEPLPTYLEIFDDFPNLVFRVAAPIETALAAQIGRWVPYTRRTP